MTRKQPTSSKVTEIVQSIENQLRYSLGQPPGASPPQLFELGLVIHENSWTVF
jgi:hypothetical protein